MAVFHHETILPHAIAWGWAPLIAVWFYLRALFLKRKRIEGSDDI